MIKWTYPPPQRRQKGKKHNSSSFFIEAWLQTQELVQLYIYEAVLKSALKSANLENFAKYIKKEIFLVWKNFLG